MVPCTGQHGSGVLQWPWFQPVWTVLRTGVRPGEEDLLTVRTTCARQREVLAPVPPRPWQRVVGVEPTDRSDGGCTFIDPTIERVPGRLRSARQPRSGFESQRMGHATCGDNDVCWLSVGSQE